MQISTIRLHTRFNHDQKSMASNSKGKCVDRGDAPKYTGAIVGFDPMDMLKRDFEACKKLSQQLGKGTLIYKSRSIAIKSSSLAGIWSIKDRVLDPSNANSFYPAAASNASTSARGGTLDTSLAGGRSAQIEISETRAALKSIFDEQLRAQQTVSPESLI